MKTMLAAVVVCASLVAGTAASSAATVHWTLAKRVRNINKSKNVSVTLRNVSGIAVSIYMPKRLGVDVQVLAGTCTRAGKTLPMGGAGFTSVGGGAKVPLKLPFASPSTCTFSVGITRPTVIGSNPTTLSIWRR